MPRAYAESGKHDHHGKSTRHVRTQPASSRSTLTAGPRPRHVVLGVNNFCNLRCVMCDVGTGNAETNFGANLMGARTRTMPWELFQRVADDMAAFCPEARLGFAFTEPLAWRPLGDALSYASALGLYTTVTTNGLLLPKTGSGVCGGPLPRIVRLARWSGGFA